MSLDLDGNGRLRVDTPAVGRALQRRTGLEAVCQPLTGLDAVR